MKKLVYALFFLALIFAISCKKSDSNLNSNSLGSFSFKGTSYPVSTCTAASNFLTATSGNSATGANLLVTFPGTAMPATGGTYVVAQGGFPGSANQVGLTLSPTLTTVYASTGGNGSNQTVTVKVTGGIVSVSGTGIELVGATPSDSSALSFNITQQ